MKSFRLIFSAPISKIIGYLPTNIPRILINRTIVHPKHSSDEENYDQDEKGFRKDYVFDAYLLGFCDDVTRVLGKLLFGKGTDSTMNDIKIKGKLLATLNDNDTEFCTKDWKKSTNVPFERVLLFPGALTTTTSSTSKDTTIGSTQQHNNNNKVNVEEQLYREIVYCDGCGERILGIVQKCISCFDYDLCRKCYPVLSLEHYGGKHKFNAESSSLE